MMDEALADGHSPLHRLDARAKLLGALALTWSVALTRNPLMAAAALGLGLSLALVARLPFSAVAQRLLVVNGFLVFLWLTLPLTHGAGWQHGALLALLITAKANAAVLLLLALVSTSPVARVGEALRRLGIPASLCQILLFASRYVHVILDEHRRLRRAAALRGFRPGTNLHTYRTVAHHLGMVLVRSLNRAERVGRAMELRGFDGRFRALDAPRFRGYDGAWLTGLMALAATIFFLG